MYFKNYIQTEKIYIGSTNNLVRRIEDHNNGNTRSTKYFVPWKLVYFEEYPTKKEAIIRERQLKKWKNRIRIEELINK
ncbi:MAG: excinuclease ABC subunit C [Candidatus Moranbacteria bacterium CG10_big_fil_rev_8_21_14_0_10_35_21]|nr:MAG: excinuclease ABC subunit C [Candidatus Moranbacteria bacterium CG10_big_fil_rev_8_21_14_0_10_35_21]